MKLLIVQYSANPQASAKFYTALGLHGPAEVDPMWTELSAEGGTFAIHGGPTDHDKRGFDPCMVTDCPLEDVQANLVAAGFDPGRIVEEDFGRSLRVIDPDGNELQINQE
ncbi:VOC family protein [Cutibacterium equinum]|uniref:VOC family protein n=1 Tax=Cutibacterium equinum TaxID=3016342 RepID=A0ABY7R212_9ACTN|nr:VOC family protein [Cutibacterium equinum]WCC80894.1 VOC family protein [Cutibacterium equinum]